MPYSAFDIQEISRETGILPATLNRHLPNGKTIADVISTYFSGWDLTTIPEAEFNSEHARRNGLKGGRPITCGHEDAPDPHCYWCRKRIKQRELRERYAREAAAENETSSRSSLRHFRAGR